MNSTNSDSVGNGEKSNTQVEINVPKPVKTIFFLGGIAGALVIIHPLSVLKTRLQVSSLNALERNAFSMTKGLLKTNGIPGLYKGFGTRMIGMATVKIVPDTGLQLTHIATSVLLEPLQLSEPAKAYLANGIGGVMASLYWHVLSVPFSVVSRRLMVQGYSGHATYNGPLDVARKVIKSDGIRGLYRGFGLSVMKSLLSVALRKEIYGESQRFINRKFYDDKPQSEEKIASVQVGGMISATVITSCITAPFDIIITRLQVARHGTRPTAKLVLKNLIAEDGLVGLYRGHGLIFIEKLVLGTIIIYLDHLSKAH